MRDEFVTVDIRLKTLAAEMVGRIVEHNTMLAAVVQDQIKQMVENGALEHAVRAAAEQAVLDLVKEAFGSYEIRQLFKQRLLASFLKDLEG
jgi:uncharacterized protein YllA (UPF0747 family)